VRVAEIDRQAGTDSEIGVTRHFLALVPGKYSVIGWDGMVGSQRC
jgi:hypothetical protein